MGTVRNAVNIQVVGRASLVHPAAALQKPGGEV